MTSRVVKVYASVALVLVAFTVYTRYHLNHFQRQNWGTSVYIEDTPDASGIRYKVLKRAYDTGNEYYTIEILIRPNATSYYEGYRGSPPELVHTSQDKTFAVKSGKMGYKLGSRAAPLEAGSTVTVPKGVPHTYWNMGDEDLLVELTVSPAGAGEIYYETLAGLGFDHGAPHRVHPMQMLLTFHRGDVRMSEMAGVIWKAATAVLVPVAEFIGFQPFYAQYVTAGGVKAA